MCISDRFPVKAGAEHITEVTWSSHLCEAASLRLLEWGALLPDKI